MNDRTRRQAAIYCRLATVGRATLDRLAAQERTCRRHAAARGYTVDEGHVYREVGGGLTLVRRPHLDALRAAVRNHADDAVIVESPARLSRDLVTLGAIACECERAGVDLLYARGPDRADLPGPGTSPGGQQEGWVTL